MQSNTESPKTLENHTRQSRDHYNQLKFDQFTNVQHVKTWDVYFLELLFYRGDSHTYQPTYFTWFHAALLIFLY